MPSCAHFVLVVEFFTQPQLHWARLPANCTYEEISPFLFSQPINQRSFRAPCSSNRLSKTEHFYHYQVGPSTYP
ncbi:putative aminopeptidase, leukotriene A4 hydrolase [Helianthus anomalus]